MISRIRGTLVHRGLNAVEITTGGGVTYEIEIPLTVYERLPKEGTEVELRTHYIVREDGVALYGFIDVAERALFGRLLTASGVGPKLALAMLSKYSPDRLIAAIASKDIATLRQIPGLGAKKAEKLAVELADRVDDLLAVAGTDAQTPTGRTAEEAIGALVALGYSPAEASAAVRKTLDAEGRLIGIDLIKAALANLAAR